MGKLTEKKSLTGPMGKILANKCPNAPPTIAAMRMIPITLPTFAACLAMLSLSIKCYKLLSNIVIQGRSIKAKRNRKKGRKKKVNIGKNNAQE